RGVVPWEMPHRWNPEALKTQAVAARSYALATLKRGRPFDLFADTRDQVYGGIRAESDATNAAIGATAGQVLTYAGRPALTYYFSTSGGRTAAAIDVLPWAPRVPYLVSVADPYDGLSPHHAWRLTFTPRREGSAPTSSAPTIIPVSYPVTGSSTAVRSRAARLQTAPRIPGACRPNPASYSGVTYAAVRPPSTRNVEPFT